MKHQLNDIVWMLVGRKVEWHQQEYLTRSVMRRCARSVASYPGLLTQCLLLAVLQLTNAGVRRPGYEATRSACESCSISLVYLHSQHCCALVMPLPLQSI